MMAGNLFDITEKINQFLNYLFSGVIFFILTVVVVKYLRDSIKKQGFTHGSYLSVIFFLEIIIAVGLFWYVPILFSWALPYSGTIPFFRWAILAGSILFYFSRRKHSEKRSIKTSILHLAILILGWWINSWIGILFFSLPLLIIFYFIVYRISLIIIPASDPDEKIEKHERFLVFCSYVWGLQMPLWNVNSSNAKEAEKRIDGDPSIIRFPGIIRMDTHQVIGISNGNSIRVAGPGVVFTKNGDSPLDVIDLRQRTRKCTIHAFSKEGIPFLADIFAVFSIDYDALPPSLIQKLPQAPLSSKTQDEKGRIFPYSNARVQAALRLRSKRARPDGEPERWDNHVLAFVEKAARETLAERSINDLWQACENDKSNASEEISNNIRSLVESILIQKGIKLIKAKASNFIFSDQKNQDIKENGSEQQIAMWNVEREREIRIDHSDALAKAKRIEEEARMNARSVLLTAIMEGLKQARRHHPKNDPEAISQVYLDALKNMINQHLDSSYKSEAIDDLQKVRDDYFSK